MCWAGNSGSWCAWGKTGRRRRFGYFGGGELETTDLGSGIGMHSSVYPYCDDFWSLGVGGFTCAWRIRARPGLKPSGSTCR
jgi:hypothetical protein